MSSYSSWGPVDDGRIKPDIVASGHHDGGFHSGISLLDDPFGYALLGYECGSDNHQSYRTPIYNIYYNYGFFNHTSCAAAATSGSIALLLEDYRNHFPTLDDPLPATIKALLIHTAEDLDDPSNTWFNKGPDYASGYGLLQIENAIDHMRTGSFLEDQVDNNDWTHYSFEVPQGAGSVKVTLVWDDAPGTENADLALVNNLRLLVRGPNGTLHYPWELDPNDPSAPASNYKTTDNINNVEQVYVDNGVIAGTWHIEVAGYSVPEGPQKFAIVANQVSPKPQLCVNPGGTDGCYNSIQAAIDAAVNWDVVRVHNGTYQENINFHSKRISVQSINGPEDTIIDGNGNGSVVTFEQTEYYDSVLDGFTITGGTNDHAGGIRIEASSPTIVNCIISGNNATDEGGGIHCRLLGASPTITNCIISGNTAEFGGGMYNYHAVPKVTGCTFDGNVAHVSGGGMYNYEYNWPTITNCNFSSNTALVSGGGIYSEEYSSSTITNCTFSGNTANRGGGISTLYHSSPTITNSIFTGNQAQSSDGGGLFIDFYSEPTLINCTFSRNSAAGNGGGIFVSSYTTTIINSILWGNTAEGLGQQVRLENSATLSISHSDVEGGQNPAAASVELDCTLNWGTGNMGEDPEDDPLFVDADGPDDILGNEDDDLHLQLGSPCIDSGDNDAVPPGITTDIAGYGRFVDDPLVYDTGSGIPPIVDIGAYEYQGDFDDDWIADVVDTEPYQPSNDFSDEPGGNTKGTIASRGDVRFYIREEANPDGVRILSAGAGGPTPAIINACEGAEFDTITVFPGITEEDPEGVVTCSNSFTVKMIKGIFVVNFVVAGKAATANLSGGNSLTCDPSTGTLTTPLHNSGDVVVLIEDEELSLAPGDNKTVIFDMSTVDIDPDTLNLKSKGKWVSSYMELPEGYNIEDIDRQTIMLEDTIVADKSNVEGVVLTAKFSRQEVIEFIKSMGLTMPVDVELTVSCQSYAGATFHGSDTIRCKEGANKLKGDKKGKKK